MCFNRKFTRWIPLTILLLLAWSSIIAKRLLKEPPPPPGVEEAIAKYDLLQNYNKATDRLVNDPHLASKDLAASLWKLVSDGRKEVILPWQIGPSKAEEKLVLLIRSGIEFGPSESEKEEFLSYIRASYPSYDLRGAEWLERHRAASSPTSQR